MDTQTLTKALRLLWGWLGVRVIFVCVHMYIIIALQSSSVKLLLAEVNFI